MDNNQNNNMLQDVYFNASMGADIVRMLMNKTEDVNLKNNLNAQLTSYNTIMSDVNNELSMRGSQPERANPIGKATTWTSVQLSTMTNKQQATPNLAEMVIEGSTMSIIENTKLKKKYPDVQPAVKQFTDRLIQAEQDNIERLKPLI